MRDALVKHLPKLAVPVFYGLCLLVFFPVFFPWDRLKERLVLTFNAAQAKLSQTGGQELAVDELGSHWVTGVRARGVRLRGAPTEAGKPAPELVVEEVRARISLLPLLVGRKTITFSVDALDGKVNGKFSDSGKEREIDVELEDLELARAGLVSAQLGFPLEGKLGGKVSFLLPEGKASKGSGTIDLEIKDAAAGNSKDLTLKTPMGPFTLPRLGIGQLAIVGEAKDGQLKISKIGPGGKDVELAGDGRVQLRELATEAMLDLNLKFKVLDGYRGKNEKTELLFGKPGSKEKPFIEQDPKVGRSKTADGFYAFHVRGTLGRPDFAPATGAALLGGSGRAASPSPTAAPAPTVAPEPSP